MSQRLKVLSETRGAKLKELDALRQSASNRAFTADEAKRFDAIETEVNGLNDDLSREQRAVALASQNAPAMSASEQKDAEQFSLTRMLAVMADPHGRLDGIEAEVVQEGAKEAREAGLTPKGIMVGSKFLRRAALNRNVERRDMTAGTANQGGDTVQTDKVGLLDHLFNRNVIVSAGATVLNGLVGNIDLPRLVVGTAPAKKAENAQADEYTATVGKLSLSPRRLPTVIEVSNQLLKQSSNRSIDAMLQNHIARLLSQVMETAFIHGGGTNEPTGILATAGIGAIYAGAAASDGTNVNGAALVWGDIINLEKEVAIDNADIGALNYLTNATQIGKAKATVRVSSTDSMFIIDDRFGKQVNGYPYLVSNNVSAALSKGGSSTLSAWIFGNFNDFVVANWGGIEFLVNPYSKDDYGLTRINAAVYYDGGVQRPVSFAAGDDFTA